MFIDVIALVFIGVSITLGEPKFQHLLYIDRTFQADTPSGPARGALEGQSFVVVVGPLESQAR